MFEGKPCQSSHRTDLDPSAGQKISAVRLLDKLPKGKVGITHGDFRIVAVAIQVKDEDKVRKGIDKLKAATKSTRSSPRTVSRTRRRRQSTTRHCPRTRRSPRTWNRTAAALRFDKD